MAEEIYLPLEVNFADDEDVAKLARYTRPGDARACRDLLVQMWLHCKRKMTDGHVPAEIVGRLVYPDAPKIGTRDADRLVDCGIAERTPDGYYFPSYLKRNKSKAQIDADRAHLAETGSESGSFGNHVRWHVNQGKTSQECSHCSRHPVAPASGSHRVDPIGSDRVGSHKDRDNNRDTDKDTLELTKSEHRNETLPASAAPAPPEEARCTAHTGMPVAPPCRGCKTAREAAEKQQTTRIRDAEQRRSNCRRCGGDGWIVPLDGTPSMKCTHEPLEVVR